MSPTQRKQDLREAVWRSLQHAGVARFPGTRGRIPNFKGAEAAAERLAGTSAWQQARSVKCNPDSPQRPVRHAALRAGKVVYMAVPRLASEEPFLALDPEVLGESRLWRASSIEGATELGRPVRLEDLPRIDLVVTGCVAVGRDGARLGKGGGYSDLEWAVLSETERVHERTPVATTVHALQLVDEGAVPVTAHDFSLDLAATPEEVLRFPERPSRPRGVLWEELPEEKIAAIPVLRTRRP